jgi:hypothetical protein
MKGHFRSIGRRALVPLAAAGLVAVLLVPAAWAASPSAVATVTTTSSGAGTTGPYTYTLTPSSGQIGSFRLTAPTGWAIQGVTSPAGLQFTSSTVSGVGQTITSSSPLTVVFTAQASCAVTGPATSWTTLAKSGSNFTGSTFTVNAVGASVTDQCTARFFREPADAAFNTNTTGPSQNITSVPYTPATSGANAGNAIQVQVEDASGAVRDGVAITLQLTSNPTGATLAGSLTATSADGGLATFLGSPNPITIDTIGQGYKMTPTNAALNVMGFEQPDAFGIYQEGEPCPSGSSCTAKGHSSDNKIRSTVTAPNGVNLGVLVSGQVPLDCAASVQQEAPTYDYLVLSSQVTVWKYVGSSTQTVDVFVDKSIVKTILNRGSAHIDFCFDSEGKTFVDKFGVTHAPDPNTGLVQPGLLPDCNTVPVQENCIVSENAAGTGGRMITVTVNDGKGRI